MKPLGLTPATEATIWSRVVDPRTGGFTPQAARALLKLDFSAADRARMEELVDKAHAGTLTPAERREAESYDRVAHLLALLHSKARRSLRRAPARIVAPWGSRR
jgi:hypothetical protein